MSRGGNSNKHIYVYVYNIWVPNVHVRMVVYARRRSRVFIYQYLFYFIIIILRIAYTIKLHLTILLYHAATLFTCDEMAPRLCTTIISFNYITPMKNPRLCRLVILYRRLWLFLFCSSFESVCTRIVHDDDDNVYHAAQMTSVWPIKNKNISFQPAADTHDVCVIIHVNNITKRIRYFVTYI